ncbi:class I SAM-dependent methyltransferase [Virgibacillus byunsanensis]|uniref:Class I SAM-dependent methyltransferase n=1 Tax=Virgibacillus byunsanensis TaxID=570945 RepID=A0ABW3LQ64_9BACI
MPVDFHDNCNKQSYTRRVVDKSWIDTIEKLFDYKRPNQAVDIGCGGGIYTKALADIGIPEITGVDFSEAMIAGAKQNCHDYDQLHFKTGNASNISSNMMQ